MQMTIKNYFFFRWCKGLLDCVVATMVALIFLQMPMFMHQYTQRLAGHVDELAIHINLLQKAAAFSDKTLDQYIHKFLLSMDPDFTHQGEIMQNLVERHKELSVVLNGMYDSSVVGRPFFLLISLEDGYCQSYPENFSARNCYDDGGLCVCPPRIILWIYDLKLYSSAHHLALQGCF